MRTITRSRAGRARRSRRTSRWRSPRAAGRDASILEGAGDRQHRAALSLARAKGFCRRSPEPRIARHRRSRCQRRARRDRGSAARAADARCVQAAAAARSARGAAWRPLHVVRGCDPPLALRAQRRYSACMSTALVRYDRDRPRGLFGRLRGAMEKWTLSQGGPELEARLARLVAPQNEYGVDPFGLELDFA